MSKALMVTRRSSYDEHLDDFPTPPWATRALLRYVMPSIRIKNKLVDEPACGRGHMVKVLRESGANVWGSDIFDYGGLQDDMLDYLDERSSRAPCDLVISNPPFKLAQRFVERALGHTRLGVAMILRTLWIDTGDKRYEFVNKNPPNLVMVYAGRMDAARGKILRSNSSFMSHSVFWWDHRARLISGQRPALGWIPPSAQRELELDDDYAPDWLTR